MSEAHAEVSYKGYWIAWGILLALTVAMIAVNNPAVLLAGITIKSGIIALWFMHLKAEKMALTAWIFIATVVVLLIMFGLFAWDATTTLRDV